MTDYASDQTNQRDADEARSQHAGNHRAAGMHRALAEAVVKLDAMGGGAAEECRVDEIGTALPASFWISVCKAGKFFS